MTPEEAIEALKLEGDIEISGNPKRIATFLEAIEVVISSLKEAQQYRKGNWIPVEQELPPNAKHLGALCPMYQLDTKYGVTEGWYNPDLESWYVLIWFLTESYCDKEIDFNKGTYPKIVRCENKVNDRHSIVTAWRPLPEPYRPGGSEG